MIGCKEKKRVADEGSVTNEMRCGFGSCRSKIGRKSSEHCKTEDGSRRSSSFAGLLHIAIALFLFIFLSTILSASAFAVQNLMALQGAVDNSGASVNGNLTVTIWTQATGGTLVYNSSSDFNDAIIDGRFDVLLGSGSQELSLEYGKIYYMDMAVNGVDLNPAGAERRMFQSSVGNVNASTISSPLWLDASDQRYNDTSYINANYYDKSTLDSMFGNYYTTSQVYSTSQTDTLLETQPRYAGFTSQNTIVDNGDGTLTIPTETANLYSTEDGSGTLKSYTLSGGTTGGALPAIPQGISYLVGYYNSGSPVFTLLASKDSVHQTDYINYLSLYREGNEIEMLRWDTAGNALAEKMNDRLVRVYKYTRESGLVLSELSNRIIDISSGAVWYGAVRRINNHLTSNTTRTILFYHNNSAWNQTDVTQYNNLEYDNGNNVVAAADGTYVVNWIYTSQESTNDEIYILLGDANYSTVGEALTSAIPSSIPAEVDLRGILVGRIVILKGASASSNIESAFTSVLSAGAVTNHNDLSGIQGGAPGDYQHITSPQLQLFTDMSSIFKVDANNGIAGINSVALGRATLQVGTFWHNRAGTLASVSYDDMNNYTLVHIIDGNTFGFDSSSYINVSDTQYYVAEIVNDTDFNVEGDVTFNGLPFSVKQSPYVDVYGGQDSELGYSMSNENGEWQWAWYTSRNHNMTRSCFSQANSSLFYQDVFCMNANGTIEVPGQIAGNIDASYVQNPYWLNASDQRYNDTALVNGKLNAADQRYNDTTYVNGINTTLQNNINAKLTATDQRFNDTALISGINTTLQNNIDSKLNVSDQRYNDTTYVNGVNTTLQNNINAKLTATDQRYNDTVYINGINTTLQSNINNKLDASDQRYNETSALTQANKRLYNTMSTGLLTGGVLLVNNETTFNITDGCGVIVNNYADALNPVMTYVCWANKNNIVAEHLTSSVFDAVAIDASGNVLQFSSFLTQDQKRDYIFLGDVSHVSQVQLDGISEGAIVAYDTAFQLNDFLESFGVFNIMGNTYSANGANLMLSKSSGKTFNIGSNYAVDRKTPNIHVDDAAAPVYFYNAYRINSTDWTTDGITTDIDPNNYDNGTGRAPVPVGDFTVQPIFYDTSSGVTGVQYGQALYDSLYEAEEHYTMSFVINPTLAQLTFRGWLIIQQGTTDLTNTSRAEFIEASKFGLSAGGSATSGGSGGTSTASNIGVGGVGVYSNQLGSELQFKNLRANSSRINVVDNPTNKTIDIDVTLTSSYIKSFGFNLTTELDNLYLAKTDQRYNDTVLISGINTTLQSNINAKLDTSDQRYNDTVYVNGINTTLQSNINAKLTATDQRFNETTYINGINTTLQNNINAKASPGTVQCSGTDKLVNITTTTGGITGVCTADLSGSFTGMINTTQINVTNTPSTGQVLTYNGSNDKFTWANNQASSGPTQVMPWDESLYYHKCSFESITAGYTDIWVPTIISTGVPALVAGDAMHPGGASISTSATASSGYAFQVTGASTYLLAPNYGTTGIIKPFAKTGNVTVLRFGFMDAFALVAPVDGVYFNITQFNMTLFNVSCLSRSNNLQSNSTYYNVQNGTWYKFEIYIENTTLANCLIYNSTNSLLAVLNVSDNIPTTTGRETSHAFVGYTSGVTTAQVLANIDFMSVYYNGTMVR